MKPKALSKNELVAMAGGLLLAFGLFLPWYSAENKRAMISQIPGPRDFSAWEAHPTMRWLLLAAAVAPFILAWIVLRAHKLSWPRGEATSVVALTAFVLCLYNGVIDRPGEPQGLIGINWGFFVSFAGTLLMVVGSALRASESDRPRKPPGVL